MTDLSRYDLERHALAWIEAWNGHDINAVTEPFIDDAVFVSPRAKSVTGTATVSGGQALHAYWKAALIAVPDLKLQFESAVCDEATQTDLVHYVSRARGRALRACELMRFCNGRQVYGEAFYGAELEGVFTQDALDKKI
jgi:steroid delta-isomerase